MKNKSESHIISVGKMHLNMSGDIVHKCWEELKDDYEHIGLCKFMIMPNHVHGVIHIGDEMVGNVAVGVGLKPTPTKKSMSNKYGLLLKVGSMSTTAWRPAASRSPPACQWSSGRYCQIRAGVNLR